MKTRILTAFVLAGGMALAQTGSNPGSPDQNQPPQSGQTQPSNQDQQQPASPSTQDQQQPSSPSTQDQQQPTSPTTQPPSTNPDQSQTAATSSANGQETVVRGCLKQSGGNWIISQNGQDTTLSGDDSLFKPHDGQQVEVHGTQSSAGALQVTSVNTISDSCGGTSDTASAGPSGPAATDQSAAGQTPSSGSPGTAQPAANPPVTNQTAPTTVGSGSQSATGTANPDQGATTGQNPPDADTPLHPGQTPEDRRQIAHNVSRLPDGHGPSLPETGSPIPLLGLLGLGSLATGLLARKKK
jgi:LPXTG-motif cell wall-anchored protein